MKKSINGTARNGSLHKQGCGSQCNKNESRLLPFLWVGVLIICSQSKSCVKEATEHCPSAYVSVHPSQFKWGRFKSPKIATLRSLGEVAVACVKTLNISITQLPSVDVGLEYLSPWVAII